MTKRSHLKICCSPLVIDQPKIIKTPPQETQSPELRLLQDDFSTDPQNWDINLCLHNAATLDPPYISTVKALLVEHPESVKIRNKYGLDLFILYTITCLIYLMSVLEGVCPSTVRWTRYSVLPSWCVSSLKPIPKERQRRMTLAAAHWHVRCDGNTAIRSL